MSRNLSHPNLAQIWRYITEQKATARSASSFIRTPNKLIFPKISHKPAHTEPLSLYGRIMNFQPHRNFLTGISAFGEIRTPHFKYELT